MSDDTLSLISDLLGFAGLVALMAGAFPGAALAARYGHVFGVFERGRAFYWHRVAGIVGLVLFFGHPIPLLFRRKNLGLVFPAYLIPVHGLEVNLGIYAFYALILVSVTALLSRYLARWVWRNLHWFVYVMLGLGTAHGFVLSEGTSWQNGLMTGLSIIGALVLATRLWLEIGRRRRIPLSDQRTDGGRLHYPPVTQTADGPSPTLITRSRL